MPRYASGASPGRHSMFSRKLDNPVGSGEKEFDS